MKRWLYYLWWKTKAIRKLVELTNCKPYHAIKFVNETTKQVQKYIWVPSDPEKFIEQEVEVKMIDYKHVSSIDELNAWYENANKGEFACYGVGRPFRPMMECAAKLSGQLFQKRVGKDLFHYLIRKG